MRFITVTSVAQPAFLTIIAQTALLRQPQSDSRAVTSLAQPALLLAALLLPVILAADSLAVASLSQPAGILPIDALMSIALTPKV